MNNDAINKFLGVIRGEINDYDDSHDKVAECKIISANDDGTYNIALISDEKTIINNIVNGTPYSYRVGSSAYLYKVRNQIASSFLIGGTKFANALNRNTSSESSSGSGTTTVVSGTSTPTIVELKGYSGTPVVSLSVNGLVANVTVNNVASANYAARSNYAVFSGAASNYLPNGNIATALAGKQSTLTFDNAPISGSTNPVISGGIYDYAVANIGWENASLVSRKAGAATVLANQTSEQEAEASYSIVAANTQITADATNSIPTAAAVYNFASQGKSINVNIPASGLYPLVASNTSTAGQVYLGMNVGTYINMADGSITSSAFHGNADSATTAKDYSAVGGIATQFARDNVAINNVNLSVSDATVTFTNAAGIAKSYTVNNVVNATTASQAVGYVAGGAIDLALKGKVYDVSWDSTQSNLYVYNQSWSDSPRSIASTEPQQEAQTAYSIVDDLSVQPGANSIPTALAVWNATLTASHINVSTPTQGNFSLVGVAGASTQANLYTDPAVYFNYSTNTLWAGGVKLGTVTGVTASTNSTALVVQSNGSSTTPLITVNVASGYSIPTMGSQTNWNAAYAAAVTNKVSSIADVTNIPTAAAVYGYAVTNVAWDSSQTELQVTKAGTTTNVATVTPEQAVQTSYAVSVNIDTESAPTSAIPTVQAVKDYTPVNQGEGISVSNKTISLNVATTNTLGGIKVGYTGTTDRTYAVTLDSGNHAYVSVPWSSTTWRPINLNGTAFLTNSTSSGALGFAQGQAMALSGSSGVVTIAANTATASGFGVIKVGSSLTAPSGVLDINTAHSNTWTAPQAFNTNVTIGGNLTVTGTTTHVNVTDLNVDKALITLANGSEYARPLTVGAGLFVANCAGAGTNTNVALVFDSNGIAYVGRANLNTAGNVIVSDNPGLIPLLGRDVSSNFTTGHLLAWTSSNNKAVDAGVAVSSAVSSASTNAQLPTAKAVYDYAYTGFVSDVSWSSDGSSLNVTKGSSTASVASRTPEQAVDTTYTILGTIPTSMSSETNQLPTAYAVYKFASQAGSLIVKNTDTSANYYLTLVKDASNQTTSQPVYDNSTIYVNLATNHMNIGTNTVVDSNNVGSYAVTNVTAGTGLTGTFGPGTGTLSLATSGVTPNTYNTVTVDTYGRVTAGSNTPYLTTQTWRGISMTNAGTTTSIIGTGTAGTVTFVNGTNIALTAGTNSITIRNTYALPLAANGTRGGIQIGYAQNGQNYPVALSSEKAYVSVPWTDHVYTATAPIVVCASTNVISLAAATEFSLGGVMAAVPWDATATLPVQINESGAMYVDALSTAAAAASFISAVTAYSGTSKTLSLAVTKNGVTTNVTVPYATNAMYGTDSSGQSDERAISYEYIHKPAGTDATTETYASYVPEQSTDITYSITTTVSSASTDSQLPTALAVWTLSQNISDLTLVAYSGSPTVSSAFPYFVVADSATGAQQLKTVSFATMKTMPYFIPWGTTYGNGGNNLAAGNGSVAGTSGQNYSGSTAVGVTAQATNSNATAIGASSTASNFKAVAIGIISQATAPYSSAIGSGSVVTNDQSIALGANSLCKVNSWLSIDTTSVNRAYTAYSTDYVFFRNAAVSTSITTQAGYTTGYTLTQALEGAALLLNGTAELTTRDEKAMLINDVIDGNFSDSSKWTVWNSSYTTISIASNEATVTISTDSTVDYLGIRSTYFVSAVSGHLYYRSVMIKNQLGSTRRFEIDAANELYFLASVPVSSSFVRYSYVQAATRSTATARFVVLPRYDSTAFTAGTYFSVQDYVSIDLTAVFGVGLEPSKAEMDAILLKLFPSTNGWFDGSDTRLIDSQYLQNWANPLFVTSLGTSGNNLTYTINGTATSLTVPYATKAMYGTDSSYQSDENPISYEYIHRPGPGNTYTDEAYAVYVPEQSVDQSYTIASTITNSSTSIPTAAAVYAFASQAGSLVVSTSTASTTSYYLMGVSTLTSASSQTVYDYAGAYILNGNLYSGGLQVLTGITAALVNAVGAISNDTTGNAATATKLGTSTIGGASRPIYLNAGTATALSSTVGSGTSPVYLSSGTITASTSTVGGATTAPVYLNAGTLAAVTSIPYSLLTGTPTIPTVTNYYWANINISATSSTTTSPTFSTATATTFYGSLSGNATSATELSNVSYSSSTMTLTLF